MAVRYTKEQLNALDKELLIQMFLNQQEQLLSIDRKLQLLLEQVAVLNHRRLAGHPKSLRWMTRSHLWKSMDDRIF